jgi:D-alanyl-D-alanine carboxypeptidase/D-alanyl-D-alanine-endopeptidase (penicillin-binding protein 4)
LSRCQAREAADAAGTGEAVAWSLGHETPQEPDAAVPTQLIATPGAGRANAASNADRPDSPTGAAPTAGVGATRLTHPKVWLYSAIGVGFALLVTGSVLAGASVGLATDASAPAASHSAKPSGPTPSARPVPATLADPTRLRTCSIAGQAADPNLLGFEGSVINATTGQVLFDRSAEAPARTASVLKTLTAAAALSVLTPDYQIPTTVYEGATPGTVVLVGGGDPTLSTLGAGQESVYRGAPKLTDLAAQVSAKWAELHPGTRITDLVLDSTLWNPSDNWDPSWERSEQTQGYQPEVTALMVDGGRANPRSQDSPRSSNPIGDAGAAFATDLGLSGASHITVGAAPAGTRLLGQVKSQPVRVLVGQMLPASDNALGEMLARVTSKVAGNNGSSASLATVIPAALKNYGLVPTGVTIRDGSGLSNDNAVPAVFVAQLMAKVAGGQQNLDIIYKALPVAGRTGTLAGRFSGANAVARGAIVAKTGWIKTEYSLAGVIHAADGSTLSFAFYALGAINNRTQPALDTITTAAFTCGDNLSND